MRPQEGIELAKKSRPDLILMDIQLPEMDGISAFNQLKRFKETCDIPVIALSVQAMTAEIEKKTIAVGFKEYITKPIEVAVFLSKANSYLEK